MKGSRKGNDRFRGIGLLSLRQFRIFQLPEAVKRWLTKKGWQAGWKNKLYRLPVLNLQDLRRKRAIFLDFKIPIQKKLYIHKLVMNKSVWYDKYTFLDQKNEQNYFLVNLKATLVSIHYPNKQLLLGSKVLPHFFKIIYHKHKHSYYSLKRRHLEVQFYNSVPFRWTWIAKMFVLIKESDNQIYQKNNINLKPMNQLVSIFPALNSVSGLMFYSFIAFIMTIIFSSLLSSLLAYIDKSNQEEKRKKILEQRKQKEKAANQLLKQVQ